MQVVYYPPNGLQTPLRSVADTNSIPTTTTTTSTNTNTTTTPNSTSTTSSSSATNYIISDAKDFIQDNSTYLLVGVGLVVLFIALEINLLVFFLHFKNGHSSFCYISYHRWIIIIIVIIKASGASKVHEYFSI